MPQEQQNDPTAKNEYGETPSLLTGNPALKAMLDAALEAKELAEATNPAKPTSRRRI